MIYMYAAAKRGFAQRELDWRALAAAAYLVDASYIPDLEAGTAFPDDPAAVLATLALTNLRVNSSGWCTADPMVFVGVALARPCGQAVVATTQGQALLRMEFPSYPANAKPDTYTLLFAQNAPGWFRL